MVLANPLRIDLLVFFKHSKWLTYSLKRYSRFEQTKLNYKNKGS